jgi:hypothetical protein
MDLPDILSADSAELERQLEVLASSSDASSERWRREARAELTRRYWTRVQPPETSHR